MKQKKSLAFAVCELAAVLLVTTATFKWGRGAALSERGCDALGGEYMLLLLPALYYAGKRTLLDCVTDIRELRRGRGG